MGMLDDLAGKLGVDTSAAGGTLGTLGSALDDLMGGADGGIVDQLLTMLRDPNGGGLRALVSKFEASGFGAQVASWISSGENQPIGAEGIQQALGADTIGTMASKLGLDAGDVGTKLAAILPQVVDKLTPAGTLPDA